MTEQKVYNTDALVDALMSNPRRGERHHFIDKVDMDRVVAALLRLTMEISVLRNRLETHECLAANGNPYSPEDVEAYLPTAEEEQRHLVNRQHLISRLVRDLTL